MDYFRNPYTCWRSQNVYEACLLVPCYNSYTAPTSIDSHSITWLIKRFSFVNAFSISPSRVIIITTLK
jgi:hypothetical protein